MDNLGLNLNDYWTLRSGLIGDAVPTLAERARREAAAEKADRRRLHAELRLQERVRSPALSNESNARSAALLCAALGEARRLGCAPDLLSKADALLAILERAALDDFERGRAR